MESRDTRGLPPSGASGTTPGSGPFGSLLQRTMSAAAPASTQTIMPSPQTMRFSSGPISIVSLNSTNLTPPYLAEMSNVIAPHHIQVDMAGMDTGTGISGAETVKRKRGRPRKYGPDGSMALALSPLTSPATPVNSSQKKRGRPPGSGKNQQLAALGGWLASSAGVGFTPHVITVAAGEDVATKIMSFTQQGPRAVCLLSANGSISNVTLRQPAASGGTVTYEGRFEILSLLGSFLPAETGGARSRTGGLSITLACPDGRVIGGGVAGLLVAASPIQMVVGSFVFNEKKFQPRPVAPETPSDSGKEAAPLMAIPIVHASMQDNVGRPEKMNGFAAKLESASLNPGQMAMCDSHHSQFQTVGTQYHSGGWPASQAMPEARHTHINITSPAG